MRKPDESSVSSTQDSEQDESENKIDQLLSPTLVSSLKAQGITELFPIQKQCFKPICDGKHMIARARTGSGKTLAFLLPMFEILIKSKCKNPRVVILAPTRELATQIATVSETTVKSLKAVAIYGGASYQMQERALRGGADIVVGTPGRLKDLLNKGTLTIAEVNHVILDEVDRMLDMGFKDDVTEILDIIKSGTKNENQLRYLFFSATLTPWVYQSSRVYMKNGEKIEIDLIGNNDLKTSEDVKHLAVSCHLSGRPSVISNLIRLYGSNSGSKDSKAIVFCQRKAEVDELALSASMANSHKVNVLHGDIPQAKRNSVIQNFKGGNINVLIATDVAARGLDIPKIDLVIQCSPPNDVESYIHRSGRTGRAGKKGIAICIYAPREASQITRFEKFAKFKFERISPPKTSDLMNSMLTDTVKKIAEVDESVTQMALPIVKDLLNDSSKDEMLITMAKAFCLAIGIIKEQNNSLLSGSPGQVTLQLKLGRPAQGPGLFFAKLKAHVTNSAMPPINTFSVTQDAQSFVFDVPEDKFKSVIEEYNASAPSSDGHLELVKKLPNLQSKDNSFRNDRRNNSFNNNGNSRNSGFRNGQRNGFSGNKRTGNFQNRNSGQNGFNNRGHTNNGANKPKRIKFD